MRQRTVLYIISGVILILGFGGLFALKYLAKDNNLPVVQDVHNSLGSGVDVLTDEVINTNTSINDYISNKDIPFSLERELKRLLRTQEKIYSIPPISDERVHTMVRVGTSSIYALYSTWDNGNISQDVLFYDGEHIDVVDNNIHTRWEKDDVTDSWIIVKGIPNTTQVVLARTVAGTEFGIQDMQLYDVTEHIFEPYIQVN